MFKIIHFSDLHVWRDRGMDGDVTLRRLLGRINLWINRRKQFPPICGRRILDVIAERESDLLLFSGDAATASLKDEFEAARELLAPLHKKWGERFILIPGNHDRFTRRAARERHFENIVLSSSGPPAYPCARTINSRIGLVLIDVAAPQALISRGKLSQRDIHKIAALVEDQRRKTPFVIVMGHYPLAYPHGVGAHWQHRLPRASQLRHALAEAGAALYLHGHKHYRWALQPDAGAHMLCVNSGPAGMKSDNPLKSAGFVEILLDPPKVVSIQATVLDAHGKPSDFPLQLPG